MNTGCEDSHVIYLVGAIGAGKSTLGKIAVNIFNENGITAEYIPEPVDKWESMGIIQEFYTDMLGKSYEFQTTAFITRVTRLIKVIQKHAVTNTPLPKVFIVERSVLCDRFFFAQSLFEDGLMPPEKYSAYCEWWNYLTPSIPFKNFSFVLPYLCRR